MPFTNIRAGIRAIESLPLTLLTATVISSCRALSRAMTVVHHLNNAFEFTGNLQGFVKRCRHIIIVVYGAVRRASVSR
jgi:hypothetical protein